LATCIIAKHRLAGAEPWTMDIISKLAYVAYDERYVEIESLDTSIGIYDKTDFKLDDLKEMALGSDRIVVKIYECDEGFLLEDCQVDLPFVKVNGRFTFEYKKALKDVKTWLTYKEVPFSTRRLGNGMKQLLNTLIA